MLFIIQMLLYCHWDDLEYRVEAARPVLANDMKYILVSVASDDGQSMKENLYIDIEASLDGGDAMNATIELKFNQTLYAMPRSDTESIVLRAQLAQLAAGGYALNLSSDAVVRLHARRAWVVAARDRLALESQMIRSAEFYEEMAVPYELSYDLDDGVCVLKIPFLLADGATLHFKIAGVEHDWVWHQDERDEDEDRIHFASYQAHTDGQPSTCWQIIYVKSKASYYSLCYADTQQHSCYDMSHATDVRLVGSVPQLDSDNRTLSAKVVSGVLSEYAKQRYVEAHYAKVADIPERLFLEESGRIINSPDYRMGLAVKADGGIPLVLEASLDGGAYSVPLLMLNGGTGSLKIAVEGGEAFTISYESTPMIRLLYNRVQLLGAVSDKDRRLVDEGALEACISDASRLWWRNIYPEFNFSRPLSDDEQFNISYRYYTNKTFAINVAGSSTRRQLLGVIVDSNSVPHFVRVRCGSPGAYYCFDEAYGGRRSTCVDGLAGTFAAELNIDASDDVARHFSEVYEMPAARDNSFVERRGGDAFSFEDKYRIV